MKSRCLVGATRTTSRRSDPSGRAGAAQDRLVGEAVGGGRLDVEDLRARIRRPTSKPATVVRTAATFSGSRWSMSGTRRHFSDGGVTSGCLPGVGVWSQADSVARVLIVIDLAEGRVYLNDPADFTRFSVGVEGEGDLAEVVRQSGLGRLRDDGEHVVVDPVALRGAGGAGRRRGLGRGLFRHVRVRRREGVDGGRRGRRPHRATRRGGLRQSRGRWAGSGGSGIGQTVRSAAGRS